MGLLRDPDADLPLALHVHSFVRGHSQAVMRPKPTVQATGKVRILLAICRLEDDRVAFRSVARHLIRGLSSSARENFQLEVLRPPTFEQLAKRLRGAKAAGEPFHVVHFDGHGTSRAVFFENPEMERNAQLVDAAELGKLLRETGVRVLILNACKSAHAEPPQQPEIASDVHQQIREFGSLALLHAYAGSGKTSTAVEFAHWYDQTDGLRGPLLFTSFEQHKKLPQVLDQLGRVFEPVLAKSGIQWLTLDDRQRRTFALQVLKQAPVLWIWDNLEPITGFPGGTPSSWTAEEQKELADFLRAARGTKARFLLTSRRDEQEWLHDLPGRVPLPNMPFEERVQMTAALAGKHGRRLDDVEDWRPLLRFTQGNPLTLTVLVGQALRDGLRSRAQVEDFVRKLQASEAVFEDEESEGRTRSLAASLAYGFENAFTEAERKQLALLHLFQGFVYVEALREMGNSEKEWGLSEVKDLTREAGIALLDRAVEVGLLTGVGGGFYNVHPALPWFFRRLFETTLRGSAECHDSGVCGGDWSVRELLPRAVRRGERKCDPCSRVRGGESAPRPQPGSGRGLVECRHWFDAGAAPTV